MAILALQAIRKMRGGSQSQLIRGSDGNLWVVKFQNNPQHIRVLANEFIATRLASAIGLTVPETDVVEVAPWLVAKTLDMNLELGQGKSECYSTGLQFGSKYVGGLLPGRVFDYLPEEQLVKTDNMNEFAGFLAFDKWTCNTDHRQAVFVRDVHSDNYRATFIDQGLCFNGGEWDFPDAPLRGMCLRHVVYAGIDGWDSFEPWLHRIEELRPSLLWEIAQSVPPEWYGGDLDAMERLLERLIHRRARVRELIASLWNSDRAPFPRWATRR